MEFDVLDDLYRDVILDHCRNPRHPDKLKNPDIIADGVNRFCGDEIHLQVTLDEPGRVTAVGFQGRGCSINLAAGSMLADVMEGRTLEEIEEISAALNDLMMGRVPSEEQAKRMGDLAALSGVRQFPVRIKCALLGFSALHDGIRDHRRNRRG